MNPLTIQFSVRLAATTLAAVTLCGCAATPNFSVLPKEQRLTAPPAGKALVNFHRVTDWAGEIPYPIFDLNGTYLCELSGKMQFQYVCDPGEQVFTGWAEVVSVVKANVAANKTYDIMVDVAMGWMTANILINTMKKDDPRRRELPDFEKRERLIAPIRTERFVNFERENQKRVAEIKRDFFGGAKADRVQHLNPDDCR